MSINHWVTLKFYSILEEQLLQGPLVMKKPNRLPVIMLPYGLVAMVQEPEVHPIK